MKANARIFFRPERCMGCLSCKFACQMKALGVQSMEELPIGSKPVERMTLTFHHGTAWVWKCQQCSIAPCAEACVSGSLRQEVTGVSQDPERCMGCYSCTLACPFGVIRPLEGQDRMAKCDLCGEKAVPACVRACLTRALVWQEPSRFVQIKRKAFAAELRRRRDSRNERS